MDFYVKSEKLKTSFKGFFLILVAIIISNKVSAQLCQGSLGDPFINITFGAGPNPGLPLSAAATSYQFVTTDCPGDGFYTVRNNTANCFGGNWYTLTADHTGDPNGYFMLINASYQPGAFYLDTVRGLCGSTTYEFAAWIINMIDPARAPNSIEPDITFSIEKTDGTILKTYNTNSIPALSSPAWKQYGFFFTTPAAVTDLVLRVVNNAPGGNGNDLGLDDITLRPCGPQLIPSITSYPTTAVAICEGTANSFTFNCSISGGFNNPQLQWQENIAGIWTDIPGAINNILVENFPANSLPGNYTYRMAVAESGNMGSVQCRIVSGVITIQVNEIPVTTAVNSGPVCKGNTIQFTATGGMQYTWTGPNGYSASIAAPVINNIQTINAGKYYVQVKNAVGCQHDDSTIVVVNPAPVAHVDFTSTRICLGDSVQLHASGGTAYQWRPATNLSSAVIPDPYASPAITTPYLVIVSNQFMCKDSQYVTVIVNNKPTADAGPDRIIISGNVITLAASASGNNLSYTWVNASFINDDHLLRPTVNPPADTKYILNVSSSDGCGIASDTMNIKVYSTLYIPNAFTPNGDGINDTWSIPAFGGYPNFDLFVYNRYGQIVFHSSNTNSPWDGKYKGQNQPGGTYVYFIDLKTGNNSDKITGTVLLFR